MLQLNPRRPFGNNSVTRITTRSYRHDYTIGPVFIMLFWRPADCIQGKGKPLRFSQHTTGRQKITGAFQNLYRKSSSSTWQHCFRPAHSLLCILSRESSCLASSDAICSLPLLIWHTNFSELLSDLDSTTPIYWQLQVCNNSMNGIGSVN